MNRRNLLRTQLLCVLCALFIGACATLPSSVGGTAEPLLTTHGALAEAQADSILPAIAQARGEQQRSQIQDLTAAVRRAAGVSFLLGNQAVPLVDGPETFASLRKAIEAATSSVNVETYIFSDDQLGESFAELLKRKAQQGVEVRVIVDAFGSLASATALFDGMRRAGVQVLEFRPLNPIHTLPWRFHNRDHRKLLVVDGKVAYTGGLNISGTYVSSSSLHPGPERGVTDGWRDTHVKLTGPVVRQFQALFFATWVRLGGQVDADNAKYFPALSDTGMDAVAAVASTGVHQQDETIYSVYMAAIEHASRRIWITQAYFAPPQRMLEALVAAAQRGVDVRVLVPGFSDSSTVLYAAQANYGRLLKGGVRLFEMQDALLHAKTAVIDDALVVIGSANLDYRSFLHNNEITAVIISGALAQQMNAIFSTDLANAKELNEQQWQQRPSSQRFKEKLSHWLDYWL